MLCRHGYVHTSIYNLIVWGATLTILERTIITHLPRIHANPQQLMNDNQYMHYKIHWGFAYDNSHCNATDRHLRERGQIKFLVSKPHPPPPPSIAHHIEISPTCSKLTCPSLPIPSDASTVIDIRVMGNAKVNSNKPKINCTKLRLVLQLLHSFSHSSQNIPLILDFGFQKHSSGGPLWLRHTSIDRHTWVLLLRHNPSQEMLACVSSWKYG